MTVTERREGPFVYGFVDLAADFKGFSEQGEVSFYFKINERTRTIEEIEEGKIEICGNFYAEFNSKGRDFVMITRYSENLAEYASAIDKAVKELKVYYSINS